MVIDVALLAPFVMALVAIIYWTSVAKPFLEKLTTPITGEDDLLAGADFTRVFVAALSIGVSFIIPAATLPMTILQGATLAAIADGSYAKIIKRLRAQQDELAIPATPITSTANPVRGEKGE
jgi:hypothetical protein